MFSFLRKPRTGPAAADLVKASASAAAFEPASASAPAPGGRRQDTAPSASQWLQQLEWTVLKRLDGQLQGDYRSLFRGVGLVLADLREYQAHDDVRHIDWNVTARMQTPYVREHQEDREVSAWLVVDLSGSVNFGSGQTSKRQLACEVATVLAHMLSRHGNRVGALLFNGEARAHCVLPARSGRRHLLQVVHQLLKLPPASGPQATTLAAWLAQTRAMLRRRSVVFVVSDFISAPGWDKDLGLLARRHEVVAVRLHDPLEMALPNVGMLLMQDAESGEQLLVDGNDAAFRKRFAQLALQRETELRSQLAQAAVDCLELSTDEALDAGLLRFAKLRKRASQLSAGGNPAQARPRAPSSQGSLHA